MNATVNNLFEGIAADFPDEVFDVILQHENIKIERIISSGHTSPSSGWYNQDKHEWVLILQGSATIGFEDGSSIQMQEGDYLNITAHRKHRVTKTSKNPDTIWLAIHY